MDPPARVKEYPVVDLRLRKSLACAASTKPRSVVGEGAWGKEGMSSGRGMSMGGAEGKVESLVGFQY